MIQRKFYRPLLLAVTISAMGTVRLAHANTLSAIGGLGFGRSTGMNDLKTPPPLLGAEYMLDITPPIFTFGAVVNENFLSYKTGESGTVRFLRLEGRIQPLGAGPFVDAQAGLAQRTQGQNTSGNHPSFGGGVGYEIPMGPMLSLSPRVDVRFLPDSINDPTNRPIVDGAMMLSFKL